MNLELKDLQDAYDHRYAFPMYLLRWKKARFWNMLQCFTKDDMEQFDCEVLAIAENAGKMTGIKILRADGRVEQQCVHGVGHTISSPSRGKHALTHGCDFCCEELRQQ